MSRLSRPIGTAPLVAMTAHFMTAGWLAMACSTSTVLMFSAPEMMMSFLRSRSSTEASGRQSGEKARNEQNDSHQMDLESHALFPLWVGLKGF